VLENRCWLISSPPLLAELAHVLTDKFDWSQARTQEAIEGILRSAEVVTPAEKVADIVDDPADNRVLEAAYAGDADVIVSGDRHLLALNRWRGIRIVPPRALLDSLADESAELDI
jgi:putative PIN family toxin of toxin-antitoxin system